MKIPTPDNRWLLIPFQIAFGLLTIARSSAGWAWAKLRGKNYDSGMES